MNEVSTVKSIFCDVIGSYIGHLFKMLYRNLAIYRLGCLRKDKNEIRTF